MSKSLRHKGILNSVNMGSSSLPRRRTGLQRVR
jgi:hypothetical protein